MGKVSFMEKLEKPLEKYEPKTYVVKNDAIKEERQYCCTDFLGGGGFGAVYRSKNLALKIMHRSKAEDIAEMKKAFYNEIRLLASLDIPGIPRLDFFGMINGENQPCLVMQYIEGKNLDKFCQENSLSIQEKLFLFEKILKIVSGIHEASIIHQDIKPDNILVDMQGNPWILDFGIAKLANVTITGNAGTPAYMSPEQKEEKALTPSCDVWALGIILYQLIEGKHPFSYFSNKDKKQHIYSPDKNRKPSFSRKLWYPWLERICKKSLSFFPSQRQETAGKLLEEIQKWRIRSKDEYIEQGFQKAGYVSMEHWMKKTLRWLKRERPCLSQWKLQNEGNAQAAFLLIEKGFQFLTQKQISDEFKKPEIRNLIYCVWGKKLGKSICWEELQEDIESFCRLNLGKTFQKPIMGVKEVWKIRTWEGKYHSCRIWECPPGQPLSHYKKSPRIFCSLS